MKSVILNDWKKNEQIVLFMNDERTKCVVYERWTNEMKKAEHTHL